MAVGVCGEGCVAILIGVRGYLILVLILHFPDDEWFLVSFHVLIYHLCIFFGEMSFQAHFLGGVSHFTYLLGTIGERTSPCQWRSSQFLQPLQAWAPGVLRVAGHVAIVLEGHWELLGYGPLIMTKYLVLGLSVGRITGRPPLVKDATSTSSLAQTFLRKAAILSASLILAAARACRALLKPVLNPSYCCWVLGILCISWLLIPYQIYDLKIFLSFCGLRFSSDAQFLIFMKSNLLIFLLFSVPLVL